jgi:hypothetical protein
MSRNTKLTYRWKTSGVMQSPKGVCKNSYWPLDVTNKVYFILLLSIDTLKEPLHKSNVENMTASRS